MKKIPYIKDASDRCIVAIVILPNNNGLYEVFVGWEWQRAIDDGYVKFYKSRMPFQIITEEEIIEACDFGRKMTKEEILRVFPQVTIENILNY